MILCAFKIFSSKTENLKDDFKKVVIKFFAMPHGVVVAVEYFVRAVIIVPPATSDFVARHGGLSVPSLAQPVYIVVKAVTSHSRF